MPNSVKWNCLIPHAPDTVDPKSSAARSVATLCALYAYEASYVELQGICVAIRSRELLPA